MSEKWVQIPGFEGRYEVSDLGRVRSVDREVETSNGQVRRYRGMLLSPGRMNDFGHVTVMLGRDGGSRCVHDLVLNAFVGPPEPGQECRHFDGDGSNNRLENLRWGSRSQNGKDTTRLGRRRFTYEQADEMRQKKNQGWLLREIAEEYGCSVSLVHQITTGFRYAQD